MKKPLISTDQLQPLLGNDNIVILDASKKRNKVTEQITGTNYFSLKDLFSDQTSPYPNTIPAVSQFEKGCQELGINQTDTIIIYDNLGVTSSPRAWWLFKIMGHKNVQVLNGGLPEWLKNGFKTEKIKDNHKIKGNFKANFNKELIKSYEEVLENTTKKEFLLIDARSSGRFNNTEPDPREGIRSGKIPNSENIPYTSVIEDGKYKSEEELECIFKDFLDSEKPLAFSCGSGGSACTIMLAAELISDKPKAIYDGSCD